MRIMLKKLIVYLVGIFVFIALKQETIASHVQGVEVYYTCIDPTNKVFRIYVKAYRDCSGINLSPPDVEFSPTWYPAGCIAPVALGPWRPLPMFNPCTGQVDTTDNLIPVPGTVCENWLCDSTDCNNGSSGAIIQGTDYRWWYREYSFANANCSNYTLVFETCCRNSGVNLLGASFCNYVSINPNLCNSSPAFGQDLVPYLCVGQTATFNPNAVDPDGDSLVFSLSNCYDDDDGAGGCNWNTYTGTSTVTQPIPSNPPMTLDSTTGVFTISPTQPGFFQVCYKIEEYRNGVLIGTYVRDIQVVVIDCPPNKPPVLTLYDAAGNELIPDQNNIFRDTVCVGSLAEYTVNVKDNDGNMVKVTFDNSIPATFNPPTNFTSLINNQLWSWNPTIMPANPITGVFSVTDDNCPIAAKADYTLSLYVVSDMKVYSHYQVNCNDVTFIIDSITGGVPPYQIRWEGAGGLTQNPNNTQMTFNHTFPGPGSYPVSLIVEHGANCPKIILDTLVIPNNAVTLDAGIDRTVCSSLQDTLGSTDISGQTYSWTPTTGLDNPNAARPLATLTTTNTYVPDTTTYYVTVSNGVCTATDSIKIVIYPKPIVYVQGKNSICAGEPDTLTGPDPALGYSYQWSTGATSQSIIVQPNTTTTYTLYTTNGVCLSDPFNFVVQVIDSPEVQIIGPTTICKGNTLNLVGVGASQIYWSNGTTGNTLTDNPLQDTVLYWAYGTEGTCVGDTIFHQVITVPAPVLDLDTLSAIDQCLQGNNYRFQVTPLPTGSTPDNYIWILGEGAMPAVIEGQNSVQYSYLTHGTKYIKIYAKTGDCPSDTLELEVHVIPHPDVDFIVPEAQCFYGNSYNFTNTTDPITGTQFLWTFPNAAPNSSTDVHPQGIVFDTSGTFSVTLEATGINNCKSSITKPVQVYYTPEDPEARADTACYGFYALLYGTYPNNVTFYWYTSPTATTPVFKGNPFQTPPLRTPTTYWIEAVTANGCPSRNRIPVNVEIDDIPDIKVTPEDTVVVSIPNAIVEFTSETSPDVEYWLWNFGNGSTSNDPNPTMQYFAPGVYTVTLTVTDSAGCSNSIVKNNLIIVEEPLKVFAPNAFSPNGDGINDVFEIKTQLVKEIQITIYDRFGGIVFTSNDVNFQWDGTYNGKACQEGAYAYVIKGKFYNNKPFEQKGSVLIIR